jgi:Tol biopolymer transport system component
LVASTSTTARPEAVVRDGEAWIAYQWVDGDGGDGVYLVRPDGTGQHQLVPELEGSEFHPDWSPDGQRIAFTREARSGEELWVVDADGSNAALVYRCEAPCNSIAHPQWSLSGAALYFGMDADASSDGPPSTFGLGSLGLATREVRIIMTREDGMTAEMPRVSPDGTQVAYMRADIVDPSKGSAIFVSDLEGGPERRLTEWDLFAGHPDWTADGRILFNSHDVALAPDPVTGNLYTVETDGSDLHQLTDFAEGTHPFAPYQAPDGAGIVFTRQDGPDRSVRRMAYANADGSGVRWLTPDPMFGTNAQVRPILGP